MTNAAIQVDFARRRRVREPDPVQRDEDLERWLEDHPDLIDEVRDQARRLRTEGMRRAFERVVDETLPLLETVPFCWRIVEEGCVRYGSMNASRRLRSLLTLHTQRAHKHGIERASRRANSLLAHWSSYYTSIIARFSVPYTGRYDTSRVEVLDAAAEVVLHYVRARARDLPEWSYNGLLAIGDAC